ncbi:comF: comF family protein [compost metagenome]
MIQRPVYDHVLIRNKSTKTQTRTGGRLSRYRNLEEVFGLTSEACAILRDKRVILVDDVLTTGATLEVAGTALWKAGIKELYMVTLAAVKTN